MPSTAMASRAFRPLQSILASSRTSISRSILPSALERRQQFHSTQPKMTVHNIQNANDFTETLATNDVVLVDFFAEWCGPCKVIAPKVSQWSKELPNIHYAKVDVDALPDVAQEYGIRAMPTFMVFKNGEKVDDMLGANAPALLKMIQKNYPA